MAQSPGSPASPFGERPVPSRRKCLVLWLLALQAFVLSAAATPPAYDHVVIVIEENEQYQAIIGSPSAPYINFLANNGVNFTRMRSTVHPSQPNYLEFFSGSNQGITTDGPVSGKFTTPNLGASLIAAGKTFAAFSESLPAEGDITSDNINSYSRRHCPWICWMPSTDVLDVNQLPRSLHKPFTAFPGDFTQLPTVSFVIPNNDNNMHNGSISGGDLWLQTNLSAYADWAKTHNSLLIVTWDEDSFQPANRIPTIFYGANLTNRPNDGSWSLHNILHTVEDMYGLPHSGRSALVPPIIGAFPGEPNVVTRTFAPGTAGNPFTDTMIASSAPNTAYGSSTTLQALSGKAPGPAYQSLVKVPNIFGTTTSQVPSNASIVSSKLVLTTTSIFSGTSADNIELHRMLVPWTDASTYNGLTSGIQLNDTEAAISTEFSAVPSYQGTALVFDTTASVLQFQGGTSNEGWVLIDPLNDSWIFSSSESSTAPPIFEVSFLADVIGVDKSSIVVAPGGVEARVTVHRYGVASTAASVHYDTSDGTATAGSDYTAISGTLTWDAGDVTPRTLTIPIVADDVIEGAETFFVKLSGEVGALVDASSTAVTINEKPFDLWRWNYFGDQANSPQAAPDSDPDGDNQTNLEEYRIGDNPTAAALPPSPVTYLSYGKLRFQFRHNPAATDLTYVIQVSSDLVTWTDGCTVTGNTIQSVPGILNYVSSGYYINYWSNTFESVKTTADGPLFMRLKITQQ